MAELLNPQRFDENALDALSDSHLRGALRHATGLFGERRQEAISQLPDWEDARDRAQEIKAEALAHLDHYLEEFVARAEAAGATVHFARDAAEANAVVLELAQRLDARGLVKSKSMTTEEMHLNEALAADGRMPVETDLGEWIIQLADETPSHIIVPAIHKTKRDVAELFVRELGMEACEDAAELTAAARIELRQRFAEADLGISGVNFGIAETGSILILENEGNARMTTSLPRTHVAVMGIEKLLPRFSDLEVFLRLLPRSGTGQHLTSYQSILTGPVEEGGEGPRELHILLLDNGRSAMLAQEVTRQSLACIRCGACLNACPVYQQIGGHAYGSVYPGPIGAVITPQLAGVEKAQQLPFASSLCGACRDVCPVKIDIPELLLHLRSVIADGDQLPGTPQRPRRKRLERLAFRAWAWAMARPARYRLAARLSGPLARAAARGGVFGALAKRVSPPLAAWTSGRELRAPATRSFRDRWSSTRGEAR